MALEKNAWHYINALGFYIFSQGKKKLGPWHNMKKASYEEIEIFAFTFSDLF